MSRFPGVDFLDLDSLLTDEDKLDVTYYLFLQDRVAEALEWFDRVDAAKLPTDDPARRAEASAAIDAVPEQVVHAVWDALIAWDPTDAVRSLTVPLLYLDHGQPNLDIAGLRAICPQVITGQTVGAGHRALQEVPNQVNDMIDVFFSHAVPLAEHAAANAGVFQYRE